MKKIGLVSSLALSMLAGANAQATEIGTKVGEACPFADCALQMELSYFGEFDIKTGTKFDDVELGGLSGIDYDPATGHYISISDDRSQKAPARFYELNFQTGKNGLENVSIVKTVTLKDKDGKPFAAKSVDPEEIRVAPDGYYWSSEGDAKALVSPFVRVASADGSYVREFKLPNGFAPSKTQETGIRNNLALESIAPLPSGDVLVGLEAALKQDGPIASLTHGSLSRITRFNGKTGEPEAEYVYTVSPIAQAPLGDGKWNDNGVPAILALDNTHALVLERGYAQNFGNTIRLYMIDFDGATDVKDIASLIKTDTKIIPVRKSLVLDFGALGLKPDNLEGMTFGKDKDGSELLIFCSDNNFNKHQKTQFYAFKVLKRPGVKTN